MEIIDNIKIPAPRFEYSKWVLTKPTDNASQLEKDRWLEKEHQRWREGYNGLIGYHYFELTQCKIKRGRGEEIRPFWRDCDDLIYEQYDKATKKKCDIIYIKRREIGLTTIFGGVVPICSSIVNAGSNNLITSADRARIQNIYLEKICVIYDNLEQGVKPQKASPGKKDGFMYFAKKSKTGEYTGLKSQIICNETVDKPDSFETYRAATAFIDEFFLHPKANSVRISLQACCREGLNKFASVVMGGSCGITSVIGMKEGIKLWKDAEALDIITVFLPGWMGISYADELDKDGKPTGNILNFCKNGHSDKQKASEWILKTREKLLKAEDKRPYLSFVKEYPLAIEEVFGSYSQGILPPEVTSLMAQQKIHILNTKLPINSYTLSRQITGEIKAIPSATGKITILEKPQLGIEYCSGTDTIAFNSENIMKGSQHVICIKKRTAQTYVAFYAERSLDVEVVAANSILLQEYYNKTQTMIETNSAGALVKAYKDAGKYYLLAKRPSELGLDFVTSREVIGYYKNAKTTERGIQLLIKYLLNNFKNIWFMRIIEELDVFMVDNTDLIDSIIACEFLDINLTEKNKKNTISKRAKKIPIVTRDSVTGKSIIEWKTIYI